MFNAIKKEDSVISQREIRNTYENQVFWPDAVKSTAQAINSGAVTHDDGLHVLLVIMRARMAGKATVDEKAVNKAVEAALKVAAK